MTLDLAPNPEAALRELIAAFVRESPLNHLAALDDSPIFEEPLVGFADGDDPLFEEYKHLIAPLHLTPREALSYEERLGAPAREGEQGCSVVCWALPIARATRQSNAAQRGLPSERWAHTRTHGEAFNDRLRQHVVEKLHEAGRMAVAPVLSKAFVIHEDADVRSPISSWSERHILYVAGMGTFSLNDGFITPKGIAMRCGSVVTDLALTPTPRLYPNHTANCLYLAQGRCGQCMERCPVGAITPQGHDKRRCQSFTYGNTLTLRETYRVATPGCGLCQTGVPCESAIPE